MAWSPAEDALMRLMPRRGRQGSTWFGHLGDVVQQPPMRAGLAAALALAGRSRGHRAALRGSACFGSAAVVANLVIKPIVGRSPPPAGGGGK